MKNKKNSSSSFVILAVAVLAVIGLVKHFHISGFEIVQEDVLYTAGQPRGMDYTRLLYRYHIGTIVNVRAASEHREQNWYNEEIMWVRNNGINYIEMPIDKYKPIPDQATQDQFIEIMSKKSNWPVLLHGSGNPRRVAILTAVWLVRSQEKSVQEALAAAESINEEPLSSEQWEFIKSLKK